MHSPRRVLIILYLILCLAILYAVKETFLSFPTRILSIINLIHLFIKRAITSFSRG